MNSNVVYTKDLVYNKKFPTVILVESVRVLDGYRVLLRFNDGVEKEVDLEPVVWGPVFKRIRNDQAYFRQVYIDPVSKTLTWPNGVDLDPDSLYYGDQEPPWWTEYKQEQKKARQLRERRAKLKSAARGKATADRAKQRTAKASACKKGVAKKK